MALRTIANPNKAVNVTDRFVLTPETGTSIAGFAAYKSGSMIALGFYLTTTQAIAAGQDVSVTYSCPAALKPAIRQVGGSNVNFLYGVNMDTTDKIGIATAQAIQSGVGAWVMITYICANQ